MKKEINELKESFAKFVDLLNRWYDLTFDEVTMEDLKRKFISEEFILEDYTKCLNFMADQSKEKYKFRPIDVYMLCKEAKICRLKEEEYKETQKRLSAPINREGREKVKMYLQQITGSLKNKQKGK